MHPWVANTSVRRAATPFSAFVLFAFVLLFWPGRADACDPFLATCTTTIAPDNSFSGWLSVQISSSGCSGLGAGGGTQAPRSCGSFVQIPAMTSIVQKCNAIVAQLQVDCGPTQMGTAAFTVDGSACASGEFKVTDGICEGHVANGTGVSLLIASSQTLGNFTFQGSGFLEDYEQDTIANDCQGSSGDSLAMLSGSGTGTAINGNSAGVVFIVSTSDIGQVVETVPTTKGMTAANIVAQGVARANATLAAFQSKVRCAQDPTTPIVASCSPAVDGGAGDAPALGAPVTFQTNDTGVFHATLAGPSKDVATAKAMIHAAGGIPNATSFNFAGAGTTCSPCDGGVGSPQCCVTVPPVPALGGPGLFALIALLGVSGLALVRRTPHARRGARAFFAAGVVVAASHASPVAAATSPFLSGESTHPTVQSADSLGTTYNGGPVLSDVQLVAVFWGPNVAPVVTSGIGGFYAAYVQASQIGWMCEYNTPTQSIGSGSFAGAFTITPTVNTTANVSDGDVQAELLAQINANHLPAPTANTMYMVHFPHGTTITSTLNGTSCLDFCAYHGSMTGTVHGASASFNYGIIPDFVVDCAGCGDRSAFDNLSKSASHEIAETITDPVNHTGWTNSRNEIGDSCNFASLGDTAYYNFTSGGTTYAAQLEWSHDTNGCVAGGPCKSCNPYQASCTTTIAPDVPFSGPLFFSVSSSGCAAQGARTCNNSTTLTPGTTIPQKCNALVSAINANCGGIGFQADSSKCSSGTFTVTDNSCNAQAPVGNGVTLMLANAQNTLQGTGMLADYEQDVVTNGCQGGGDSVALLNGTATGTAINGTQPGVVFIVTTPDIGQVVETIPTPIQTSAASVVSQAVARANATLTAFNSVVRCVVDPVAPTLAACTSTPKFVDGGEGSGTGDPAGSAPAPTAGVPVSFQLNDTGMTRAVLSGPAKDVASAKQMIRASGGIPNVLQTNFVGGTTCSPCDGGVSGPTCCVSSTIVPALGGTGVAWLGILLGAAGLAAARAGLRVRRAS